MRHLALVLCLLLPAAAMVFAVGDEDGYVGPNRLRTAPSVTTYLENDNGTPAYVSGQLAEKVARGTEIAAAYRFFEDNKGAYRMAEPGRELEVQRIDVDELGMRHVRMRQEYEGLPVIGGELVVHFTEKNVLRAVNGSYVPELDLDVAPRLSSSDAASLAAKDLESFFGKGRADEPTLVIFPWEGTDYLAWRLFMHSDTPMGRWEYFVDAATGDIVYKANRIMDTEEIGTGISVMGDPRNHIDTDYDGSTYRMYDYTRQAGNDVHGHGGQMPAGNYIQTNVAGSTLPGTVATDADNYWDNASTQSPAVDGHVYTGLMYDYLLQHLGRNGYNDAGASMLTIVNYSGDGDNNAYWDGSRIVVWSWSSGWRSLAGCPDVIAHEWGHAVTEYTSGLVYQKEPGALNESFSDMIGAAFEFYHDTLDTPDWYMGENGSISGNGFRSLENPHEFGDPDTYGPTDPYWIDVINCSPSYYNDYCGVHTNSGVGNKWFFLLSSGGTHNGVNVTGIGVQNAMKVAYRANAFYWNSQTDYNEAALATLDAADDLDPSGVWSQRASQAWNAVNVETPLPSLRFNYPDGRPETVSPTDSTEFTVWIQEIYGGERLVGSERLHYSIDGALWEHQTLIEIAPDTFTAVLPPLACTSAVDYYLTARMSNGLTIEDGSTTDPYAAFAASEVTNVLIDDFETDLGWTVSGDATDGQWDRGVPIGGGDRGDPPTDYDGSGQCYLTDNVDDNSDVDGGTTILTSPVFDLSGGDGLVSYARWFDNTAGSAPSEDEMRVYVSGDNGSSWMLVETVGPTEQSSGGWYEHSFWVSDFMSGTAQMKVKFEADDVGSGSVVEAGVDAFSVRQYSCTEDGSVQIATTTLPDWTIGMFYSEQLSASGGNGALTWSDLNGDLTGTGLSMSADGIVSGTPTATGTISFTAHVVDEELNTDDQPLQIVVNDMVAIIAAALPEWTVAVPYAQQLTSSGGTGDLTWSDLNGDLAGTGLALTPGGALTGTPTVTGTIAFTAQVVDEAMASDTEPFEVVINTAVAVNAAVLPDWTAGHPYTQQLTASGGTGIKVFSDKFDDLSGSGLALTGGGELSGTPSAAGAVTFTAVATDEVGGQGELQFGFTVNPEVSITTASLPDGTEGQAYSYQLEGTGGTGVLTWSDLHGDLAAFGLTLTGDGLLSGTPTDSGVVTFTARAEDEIGASSETEMSLYFEPGYICGDVDGSDSNPNVQDLTYLVNFVFKGGPPPPIEEAADVDASGAINVTDLTTMVNFLFKGGSLNCP